MKLLLPLLIAALLAACSHREHRYTVLYKTQDSVYLMNKTTFDALTIKRSY